MTRRLHTHPCEECLTDVPCDGVYAENYDGWPAAICDAFHGPEPGSRPSWLCEECHEKRDRYDPNEHCESCGFDAASCICHDREVA